MKTLGLILVFAATFSYYSNFKLYFHLTNFDKYLSFFDMQRKYYFLNQQRKTAIFYRKTIIFYFKTAIQYHFYAFLIEELKKMGGECRPYPYLYPYFTGSISIQ